MRITIVASNFPTRGETFIREHAVSLSRRGHCVTVVATAPGRGITDDELRAIDGAGVRRLYIGPCPPQRTRRAQWLIRKMVQTPSLWRQVFAAPPWTRVEMFQAMRYKKAILKTKPDIVHIHYGSLAGPLYRLGIPGEAIVTWHGYDANLLPRSRGDSMYAELFTANICHSVGSRFMRSRLQQLGANPRLIAQVPMGIDVRRFSYREPTLTCPLRIISVGRLDEMKGHRFLIAAVCELLNEGRPLVLQIIGGGPLEAALREQIAKSCRQDQIHLLGPLPSAEVAVKLRESNVFALTGVVAESGRVETQGVVFAEAQAVGLPVIACNVGGVADSIIDGETGILCPPQDIEAIKKAIEFFLENPGSVKGFAERGRRFVEEKFSTEIMIEKFEALYWRRCAA